MGFQSLWQLVRHLSVSPSFVSNDTLSLPSSLDASTPSTALFDWLRENVWRLWPVSLYAKELMHLQSILKLLLARTGPRWEWEPQEMQVLLSVLRQAINAAASPGTPPVASNSYELISDCLEICVRWASARLVDASELRNEVVHAAAKLASEAACQTFGSCNLDGEEKNTAGQAASLMQQALHLWVLVGRLRSCPIRDVVDQVARLMAWPGAAACLLDYGGPTVWRDVLKALLLDLTDANAALLSATDVEYRLVRVCMGVVAGSSHIWAWDAWAEILMQLPEDEEEVVDNVLWPADSVGWRRESATYAVLEAMDAPTSWQDRATASVGAVALLSGRFDDDRLWKKLLGLLKDVIRHSVHSPSAHCSKEGEGEEWEGLRMARVGLCRALVMLGNSRFCARSFEGESRAWTREWGVCLTTLLTLSFDDVVVAADMVSNVHSRDGNMNSIGSSSFNGINSSNISNSIGSSSSFSSSKQPQHNKQVDILAANICERCLSPVGNRQHEMAKAITALFKASDAIGQIEAFSILRSNARTVITADITGGKSGTYPWGLVLLLQICLVLSDPASAAIASTGQVIWVLEVLDTVAALVGPASPPSILQDTLLQASGNLQAVLEDDVEEGWLKEARDWIMKALGRQKERAKQRAKEMASLGIGSCSDKSNSTDSSSETPALGSKRGEQIQNEQQQHQEENRLAFLINLAFAMCIQTRRPAPHHYVAELTRFLLQEVLCPYFPKRGVAQAQVHRCLRSLISHPNLLAYRAGRIRHWDEARRRVMATYVRVSLEAYPTSTAFQDLAYCVGAVIGATPTEGDPGGQALLLHCLHLIQDRALALLRREIPGEKGMREGGMDPGPAQLRRPETRKLVKLLFQTLLVCPFSVLEVALQSLGKNFLLQGFEGRPESYVAVLRVLKDVVFGDVETMRQSVLAKWYLTHLREKENLHQEERSTGVKHRATSGMTITSRL